MTDLPGPPAVMPAQLGLDAQDVPRNRYMPYYSNGEVTDALMKSCPIEPEERFATTNWLIGAKANCNKNQSYHPPSVRSKAGAGKSKRVSEFFAKSGGLQNRLEQNFRETRGWPNIQDVVVNGPAMPMRTTRPWSSRAVLTRSATTNLMHARGAFSARSAGHGHVANMSARSRSSRGGQNSHRGSVEVITATGGQAQASHRSSARSHASLHSSRSVGPNSFYPNAKNMEDYAAPAMYNTTNHNYGKAYTKEGAVQAAADCRSAGVSFSGFPQVMKALFNQN